jgi:hypothetical protein
MFLFKERKTDSSLKEIRLLYGQLHLLFDEVAQAFVYWACKQEEILLEAGKVSVKQAKSALLKIDQVLARLQSVERKYKFDKRVLEDHYRDQLNGCKISIEGVVASFNEIWKCGKPSEREVPFGDTTNYKFIMNRLIGYMNRANNLSRSINSKVEEFNKANKDLPPLPKILDNMAAPEWAKNI